MSRVVAWIEGDPALTIINRIATKSIGGPYTRDQERVIALIEPNHSQPN